MLTLSYFLLNERYFEQLIEACVGNVNRLTTSVQHLHGPHAFNEDDRVLWEAAFAMTMSLPGRRFLGSSNSSDDKTDLRYLFACYVMVKVWDSRALRLVQPNCIR